MVDIFLITNVGRVYLARDVVDRDVLDNYVISVSAYSSNQVAAKILGTVTVAVSDINDNILTFSQVKNKIKTFDTKALYLQELEISVKLRNEIH